MSDNRYFYNKYKEQQALRSHGFDAWPDAEELARYVFALEDKVDVLASIAGVDLERDVRGRLRADRREGVS